MFFTLSNSEVCQCRWWRCCKYLENASVVNLNSLFVTRLILS
jgi:hypothetical protein